MLEQIREFGNKKIVRLLFALFLVIPFGLFGIDFYFKSPVGGDTVATVGNARIGQQEFDNAVRRQGDQYRQQFGANFDPALMENPEMRRGVLDRLVAERLLAVGAQDAGIRVGDQQLAERIKTEPAFHDPNGQFSRKTYEAIAKQEGLTAVGLDERLRESMRQAAYRDAVIETAFVPRATLDNFIRLSEQTREVSVVNFSPESYLAKVKVTPEQAKAYYDGHAAEFTQPEQVRAEFLELSADALAAQTPVPAEDVKRIYEEQLKAGRWGTREERKASHILISTKPDAKEADLKAAEIKAQAIAAEVRKKGADFAAVAKRESQDPGSAAQGGDLGFFARGSMVKPFEDAAFAAKKGDIVGPVKSDFGWHVIQVTDIRPERVKSLAEATPEIEAEVKKGAAARKFAEVAESFTNIVYEQPSSLKPAADLLKLNVQPTPWFSKAFGAPPALANPKLLGELFSSESIKAKRNTTAIEVRPGVLIAARVVEHKAAELRPYEAVQAEITRRLQREEAMKLAQAEGEAKLKDAQAGKEGDLKWPAVLAVNRQKPGGLFPPVLDAVLRADAKKLPAYVGVSTPAGYSLVRVAKVVELEKIDDAKREGLGTQLRSAVAAQQLEASLASVRSRVGVSMRKDVLEKKEAGAAPQKTDTPQVPRAPSKFGGS
jgi:peptidyl-prolyl cis-trans isomerase D